MSESLLAAASGGDDLLVDLVANVGLIFEGNHIGEAGPLGNGDRGEGLPCVLVADVLDEQQDENVVLVLAGVHAAAQFVAARPKRRVEFGFLEGHRSILMLGRPLDRLQERSPFAVVIS
jgi:hypothetical protein